MEDVSIKEKNQYLSLGSCFVLIPQIILKPISINDYLRSTRIEFRFVIPAPTETNISLYLVPLP